MTNECRHCKTELTLKFLDLGHAPPSNAYLTVEDLSRPEITFPLRLWVCSSCRLVQTEDFADADQLFTEDYAYFSSTSKSWLAHAAEYVDMIVDRLSLTSDSHVIEVASNDGYLLKTSLRETFPVWVSNRQKARPKLPRRWESLCFKSSLARKWQRNCRERI